MPKNGRLPVVVLETQVCFDSSNFQIIIEQAREAYQAGTKRLILYLKRTHTLSTYGFFALHTIVPLLYDEPLPTLDFWNSNLTPFEKANRTRSFSKRLLLRNPKSHVAQAIFAGGFHDFAEFYGSAD